MLKLFKTEWILSGGQYLYNLLLAGKTFFERDSNDVVPIIMVVVWINILWNAA